MITVKDATVKVTEQTLRELLKAVEKAKETIEFTTEPMPDGDMEVSTFRSEQAKRGKIMVTSQFAPISFLIDLEVTPRTQESVAYKWQSGQLPSKEPEGTEL